MVTGGPGFYDDTIFQIHLSENNICPLIMRSANIKHINIEGTTPRLGSHKKIDIPQAPDCGEQVGI